MYDRLCGLMVRVPGYRSRGPGFGSRLYQIFWEVVGLERVQLSLVSTIEELLGRNNCGSGLENREYGRGDPLRWPRDTLYPQKLTPTSPTCGGRSVGIVRLRTKATEFVLFVCYSIFVDIKKNDTSLFLSWIECRPRPSVYTDCVIPDHKSIHTCSLGPFRHRVIKFV
jgi:hypothetical protein